MKKKFFSRDFNFANLRGFNFASLEKKKSRKFVSYIIYLIKVVIAHVKHSSASFHVTKFQCFHVKHSRPRLQKLQTPISTLIPPFQDYPPFLAKHLIAPKWLDFWKVLQQNPTPPCIKGGCKNGGEGTIFASYRERLVK